MLLQSSFQMFKRGAYALLVAATARVQHQESYPLGETDSESTAGGKSSHAREPGSPSPSSPCSPSPSKPYSSMLSAATSPISACAPSGPVPLPSCCLSMPLSASSGPVSHALDPAVSVPKGSRGTPAGSSAPAVLAAASRDPGPATSSMQLPNGAASSGFSACCGSCRRTACSAAAGVVR